MIMHSFRYPFLIALLPAFLFACNTQKPPRDTFDAYTTPAPPDYSQLRDWAAHPNLQDQADTVPDPRFHDRQAEAKADVFFIHPTTSFDKQAWNGDLQDKKLNHRTENLSIRHQASIFNGAGRVYAPRYRQMVFGGFFEKQDMKSVKQASYLAYQDVKNAFQWYLEHENEGRPFILASHSQGTVHAMQLIRNEIENKPVMDQLIAAYLVGWSIKADTFEVLKPCENADETGCFVSWCSFEWGHKPDSTHWYAGGVSVNPVSWTRDTVPTAMEDHKAVVMSKYRKLHTGVIETKVEGPYLWVKRPKIPGTWIISGHNFHIADYNLFWGDVRENAMLRVESFLKKQSAK